MARFPHCGLIVNVIILLFSFRPASRPALRRGFVCVIIIGRLLGVDAAITAAVSIHKRGMLRPNQRDSVKIIIIGVIIILVSPPAAFPEPLLAVLLALFFTFALLPPPPAFRLAEFPGSGFGSGQGRDGGCPAK